MRRLFVIGLALLALVASVASANGPDQKPSRWAYDKGLISPDALNLRDGLVHHAVLWEGGGDIHDIGGVMPPLTGGVVTSWATTEMGVGVVSDGTNDIGSTTAQVGLPTAAPMTVTALLIFNSDAGRLGSHSNSGTSRGWFWATSVAGAMQFTTIGVKDYDSGINLTAGNVNFVAAVLDEGFDVTFYIYDYETRVLQTAFITHTAGMIAPAAGDPFMLADSARFSAPLVATFLDHRVYDRALGQDEIRQLYEKPFADVAIDEAGNVASIQAVAASPTSQIIIISWLGGFGALTMLGFIRRKKPNAR